MSKIEHYLRAATRDNTRKSYRSAIEHYEVSWQGVLPATAEQIARYLADHADTLAYSTLKQRLAALAQWHQSLGFADPTKAPLVKKVLKGIAELHPAQEKQARPLQLETLETICQWLDRQIRQARQQDIPSINLGPLLRNKALLLIGFWRAFRSDELCRLRVEQIVITPGEGMALYLPRTKTDTSVYGVTHRVPMLSRLCPVSAYLDWIHHTGLQEGPVFRKISQNGVLSEKALNPRSIIPLLRQFFFAAGVADAGQYSSHSLRRGFASWAGANQWDLKSLMAYVGWKHMHSAQRHIEQGLQHAKSRRQETPLLSPPTLEETPFKVRLSIFRFHEHVKTKPQVHQLIETFCFAAHNMEVLTTERDCYRIRITHRSDDELTSILDELLQQMHELANERKCMLEVSITNELTGKSWH